MLKMPSLYEQNPAAWDALEAAGYRSAAAMSKHFHKASIMDRALGYENSVARWHRGEGRPSGEAEARASNWLRKGAKAVDDAPRNEVTAGTLLLVACDAATATKAKRVLSILGCEVTEV